MTSSFPVPVMGSAAALAAAAAKLGVAFDRDALDARFAAHPAGLSLRALVEIAPELGLQGRAFRSDIAGLAGASLPAVVHLVDPATEETGFAILTELAGDRVRLVSDATDGEHVLTVEQFAQSWSGILVSLERMTGAVPVAALARRGPWSRVRAWYWKDDPLARAAMAGRVVGGGLLLLLGTWSAVRYGAARGFALASVLAIVAVLLAAAGAVLSATLFYTGRRTLVAGLMPRLASSVCGRGRFADCLSVLATKFARVAGIDWASIGLALFASHLVLFAVGALLSGQQRDVLLDWLAIAYLIEVPGALFFAAIQVWPLRRLCPLCLGVHAVVLLSALLGVLHLMHRDGFAVAALLPFAAAHLAVFFGAFALLMPLLAFGLEAKVSRIRLGWVAATPWGALAEIAGREPIKIPLPDAPIRLGHGRAPFKLDVLAHPFCSGCGPVVVALRDLAGRYERQVTVGIHVPVRDTVSEQDRALCVALAAVGLCEGGERGVSAFLEVKADPRSAFAAAAGGAASALAHLLGGTIARATEPGILDRATAALDAINRFADAIERGTPTLVVNGRLWDGTMEDLDALLTRYAPLLADVLQIPRAGQGTIDGTTPIRASEP